MNKNKTFTPAQQLENLVKLKDYLATKVNPDNFDMRRFRSNNNEISEVFFNKNKCGTSGCALGWAPFVKGLEVTVSDYFFNKNKREYLNFNVYSKRIFGFNQASRNWVKLFACNGIFKQNTLQAVIKRIDNYILTTKGK